MKKKPRKLSEADFDDDGLIEDFEEIEAQKMGAKFKAGLEKSRQNFQEQLNNLIARYRKVDEDFFEALEEMLITADVGFNTVMTLTEELRMEAQRRNIQDTEDLREVIVEKIVEIYHQEDDNSEAMNIEDGRLNVILMVGVNGVGKTTTIGKFTTIKWKVKTQCAGQYLKVLSDQIESLGRTCWCRCQLAKVKVLIQLLLCMMRLMPLKTKVLIF